LRKELWIRPAKFAGMGVDMFRAQVRTLEERRAAARGREARKQVSSLHG